MIPLVSIACFEKNLLFRVSLRKSSNDVITMKNLNNQLVLPKKLCVNKIQSGFVGKKVHCSKPQVYFQKIFYLSTSVNLITAMDEQTLFIKDLLQQTSANIKTATRKGGT